MNHFAHIPVLACAIAFLAPNGIAQVRQHTLTATVTSNTTTGIFSSAAVGSSMVAVFDIDHWAPVTSSTPDSAMYGGAILAITVNAGGASSSPPLTASMLEMIDNRSPISVSCVDIRGFAASALTDYNTLSVAAFDAGIDPFGAALCPVLNTSTSFPDEMVTLASMVDMPAIPITTVIAIQEIGGGLLEAEVTGEVITNITVDFCIGDGGDQMGCTNCPCGNNAPVGSCGGCLNSAGTALRLIATGSSSVSLPAMDTTDLRFRANGAPAGAFCILNSGDAVAPGSMANPCFGLNSGAQAAAFDGLRCAIMNTRRHGGRSADSNGDIGVTNNPWGGEGGPPVGLANAGAGFIAGQTRYFQIINRDDPLVVCMRGLNTSQAVEVTFTP